MPDHFGDLANHWAVAEGLQSGGNQTTVSLTLGASSVGDAETALEGTALTVILTGTADGQSGQFGASNATIGVRGFAIHNDGEYVGNGKGAWSVATTGGSWELNETGGETRFSGTLALELRNQCATSLSSATYNIQFDIPVRPPDSSAHQACQSTLGIGEGVDDEYLFGGRLELTVDGESWTPSETNSATYLPDDSSLALFGTDEDRTLSVEVDSPEFGANQPSAASYQTDSCAYGGNSLSDSTVTVEENDSGSLEQGPTSGTVELQLSPLPENGEDCSDSPVSITGQFGLAVCGQSPDQAGN
jgi:hypothetical protein